MSELPPADLPPAAPAPVPPAGTPKGPSTLGIVAFALAVAGAVAGSVLVFVGGLQVGSGLTIAEITPGTTVDASALPDNAKQLIAVGGILTLVGWVVFVILGLWGLIQGIVAAVKNRGRGWGIAAIVIAVVGVVAVIVFSGTGLAVGAASLVGS